MVRSSSHFPDQSWFVRRLAGTRLARAWVDDIIVPAVLILGVSCFVLLVRSSTRRSVRKTTTRTAEDLYPLYADSIRKQRKYAKEHGGQWRDDEGSGHAAGMP
jgi:hypothetical protein